ncbi:MAG: hypothetical protein HDR50_07310 [Desulfovibrio sp.]|uniref:hypothetical protein n=1 Tax=Desulfovibrio sp. TaxID=885 RepID=UPI001A772026|nr:hypothetical protein [Desulfovibrio sp.]MBD5417455.1 hypothetical protein [Desulfovibrio sp.]
MPGTLAPSLCRLYDRLYHFWEGTATQRRLALGLLWIYLLTLGAVELGRQGLFPAWLPAPPASHFWSIELAFTLILVMELLSLIFVLPASLSRSMGKQFEILTLILLRNAFKELPQFGEPVEIGMGNLFQVGEIAASAGAALLVFLCLGVYRHLQQGRNYIRDESRREGYVLSKKLVALILFGIFAAIGVEHVWAFLAGRPAPGGSGFFETIYTVLIFADIAMVLIAQRYMPSYFAVFRNSGFVIGTLLMRLSLSAPPYLCAGLAVFAALYVLALTWGIDRFGATFAEEASGRH